MSKVLAGDAQPTGHMLFGLLAWGVTVWISAALAFIVWFFAQPGEKGLGAVAAPFYAFMVGYPAGGLAIGVVGLVTWVRGQRPLAALGWALTTYVLPLALMLGVFRVALGAALQTSVERDLEGALGALAGPLLVVLYLGGLVFGFLLRRRPLRWTALAIVTPPLAGTVVIGAWALWAAVGSAEFRYRDAFELRIERAAFAPRGLVVDATLTIKRDGRWDFHVIYLETASGTSGGRVDAIRWLDGAGPPQRAGTYRLRLVWNDLETNPRATERRVFFNIREQRTDGRWTSPVKEFRI